MINRFEGEYAFLSNFWKESDGLTLEHRFQAAKTDRDHEKAQILAAPTPAKAKYYGRSCTLRPDWERAKDDVMLELLREKFKDSDLAKQLLDTGDDVLIEGNWWNDRYWGVDLKTGTGKNVLGKMLMRVRLDIREAML